MIEVKPKHCSVDEVNALLKEVGDLPDINKGIWTHNERELIGFCARLGAALAGEHLLRRPDVDGDLATPECIDNLLRLASEAHGRMRYDEVVDDWYVDELKIIEECIDALRKQVAIRRRMAAPAVDTGVNPDRMPKLMRRIYDALTDWRLTEVRDSYGDSYPLIDALSTTDLTVAQGMREAAVLAEYLAEVVGSTANPGPTRHTISGNA